MKSVIEEEALKIRKDSALTKEQRDAALQKILADTEHSLTEILGEDGLKSFQDSNSSYWLQHIVRKPH